MLKRRGNVVKCYVCLKEFKENEDKVYLTGDVYRHADCYIGSTNWFKYKPESKYSHLFKGDLDD